MLHVPRQAPGEEERSVEDHDSHPPHPMRDGHDHTAPPYSHVADHDFFSVHNPNRAPSQRSTVPDTTPRQPCRKSNHRKLILCFDGTGNKFHGDDSDSNILKIFRMLDRTASDQYHYYQPGIGTYVVSNSLSHTSMKSRFRSWYMKAKDSAVGSSFDQHVVGGYRFLMRFYCPGDDIFIFGFSRGAYIARFLAEMLDYVGLLSHGNEEMVAFAWKAFSQWQCRQAAGADEGDEKARRKKIEMYNFMKGFRETFSRPVKRIRFLGLFDTVNSVPRFETAWMQRSKFPYTARSSAKVIRHAVSIDERRAKFRQDLMYQSDPRSARHRRQHAQHEHHFDGVGDMLHDIHEKYRHRPSVSAASGGPDGAAQGLNQHHKTSVHEKEDRGRRSSVQADKLGVPGPGPGRLPLGNDVAPFRASSRSKSRATHRTAPSEYSSVAPFDDGDEYYEDPEEEDESHQDIDEVWFAGGHGDVGGGWPVEADTRSTSHVPLVWMVREAMKAGLAFDIEKVVAMGCSEALGDATRDVDAPKPQPGSAVPAIRVQASSPPASPGEQDGPEANSHDTSLTARVEAQDQQPSAFHEMMHRAHCARIHDSLNFDCGMSFASVLSWKIMEYMPFRRMDLQADGTWNPIRWPLPCGEVRDIPDNVRVHGSVVRRMKQDSSYRPGNLIVGGGGRGCRVAPETYGMGEWECVANPGDPVSEVWKKRT